MDHEGKQPIFVYLCALLFEINPPLSSEVE